MKEEHALSSFLMVCEILYVVLCYLVQKTAGSSHIQQQQQQPSNMSGLQQCIDMPLLVDSADQLGMDSDDLVPTLTVCLFLLIVCSLHSVMVIMYR